MFKNWEEKRFNFLLAQRVKKAQLVEVLANDVLAKMPTEVGNFMAQNVVFFDSTANAKEDIASTFLLSEEPKQQLIYLSKQFFRLGKDNQRYIIAHEIAHAYLGHCLLEDQSFTLYQEREKEADEFAKKYGFEEIFSLRQMFSWSYIKENANFYNVSLSILIVLVFLWLIFLEKLAFLFKWAVYM